MLSGVIAAISDFSVPIDRVVGTSSGALAAALFANGMDAFEIATGSNYRKNIVEQNSIFLFGWTE